MKNMVNVSPVLLIFYLFIFVPPTYWIALGRVGPVNSLIEYRTLAGFPELPVQEIRTAGKRILQGLPLQAVNYLSKPFIKRGYQIDFEKAVSEQFPLRSEAIMLSNSFDRVYIHLAYAFLNDPAIPTDVRSGVYEVRKDRSLIIPPAIFEPSNTLEIDEKIDSYNRLIKAHPGINFYLLYIELIEFSDDNPLNSYFPNADKGQSFDYFMARKPAGLNVGKLELNGYDDYDKYFYRTDLHWNIHGTLRGYNIVYSMLKENFPDISAMHPLDAIHLFPDIKFRGSLAREAFYLSIPPDIFEVADFSLPPYVILDQGGQIIDYNKHDEYFAGNYSTSLFADHYKDYNGTEKAVFLEYIFDNGSKRNLLLVGDCFTNPFEPIIASHYHHTYSIDTGRWRGINFSLSEFLVNHEVDDVVILSNPSQTLYRPDLTVEP